MIMRSKTEIAPVLTIAGSDCSGGAGVQADLKTFLANGVYGMSVITALTSQNTKGVQFVEIPSKESIASQLDAVFTDIPPRAVKIGMLPNADICRLIAEKLVYYQAEYIVVDPVMIASSGARLSDESVARAMEEVLFPLATVSTPSASFGGRLARGRYRIGHYGRMRGGFFECGACNVFWDWGFAISGQFYLWVYCIYSIIKNS
jgi:hydroxymethylpyrimidine kinase/phosphomethylpyrimidine kinase